jgi:AcrR family transcriptional regulator
LYFKSKEELINELYKNITRDFNNNVLRGYKVERSFKQNYFEMLTIAVNYYLDNPDRFSFIEQYTYSPFLFKETKEENLAVLEPLQKIIKKAKKEKLVKNLPETLLVALSIGPVISMMKLFTYGKADLKKETTKEELINACWQSISN